jgi:hypothetical protein
MGGAFCLDVVEAVRADDHDLLERWHDATCGIAEHPERDRHGTPAHDLDAFGMGGVLDGRAGGDAISFVRVAVAGLQEEEAYAETVGVHPCRVVLDREGGEQVARDLREQARPVAGFRVGRDGTAMFDAGKSLQRHRDDVSAWSTIHVGDEPDAARVALEPGVVQAESIAAKRVG